MITKIKVLRWIEKGRLDKLEKFRKKVERLASNDEILHEKLEESGFYG